MRVLSAHKPSDSGDNDDWETNELLPVVPNLDTVSAEFHGRAASATGFDGDDDLDATVTSLRGMKLMAPPPAQDGGAFDRGDPFSRQRQPSPHQQQHALFDPNATYEQPVSPAIATAAVSRYGPLDPVLLAGIENQRERLSVLKFEDAIVRFIKNPRESQLSFPPLSSYHRLIIHRLADRCGLVHQTADYNPYAQGYDGNASRVVTLLKTTQTLIPRVLLIDLSADKQQPTLTPASAPKIMMRKRAPARGPNNGGRGQDAKNQQRTIEDRERAYAEARARIFGDESSSSSVTESSSTSSASSQPISNNNHSKSTTNTTVSSSSQSVPKMGGGRQAAGPDGSRGFGRGNGSSGTPTQQQKQEVAPPTPNSGRGNCGASSTVARPTPTGSNENSGKPQQNWKESKVLWRNREQELNDPDFTRNHDAYRPSRDQQSGNGGFNTNGRGGGQQQYYDGPRSAGFQNGGQQSFSGRGRGPPPSEYNRIEPSQRLAYPPPPPPSDYYRQHPSIHPPPPPPSGYQSSYSPHARGGYSNAPPLPSSQTPASRRGSDSVQNGGYNDDFPPLGK